MSATKVLNPFDGSVVGSVDNHSEPEVFAKIEAAHRRFLHQEHWLKPYERKEILLETHRILSQQKEVLIRQSCQEGGKPWLDSEVEINRGLEGIMLAIEALSHLSGREIPMGLNKASLNRIGFTRFIPRGLVVAISAFNHPFNLIIHQVIPAIAAGAPVIVKPSSDTPLSCISIVDALHKAGLPQDYCQWVFCDRQSALKMVQDHRNAFLSFIGSGAVGWQLRAQLPPGAACALEHGGVAAVIIDRSADLERAVPALVKGAFYHAGQVCVSVQRIFVDRSIREEFLQQFSKEVQKLKVGDPVDPSTEVGPLIRPQETQRVADWVDAAVKEGAEVITGAKLLQHNCYAPTILLNPKQESKVSQEEVFGPLACVYDFEDRNQAIALANKLPFAFQASVFAQDLDVAIDTAHKLKGQSVMINEHTAFRVDWMPFGGFEKSGLGLGGIEHSIKDMSVEKLYVLRHS